ncbi:PH domain-containing protein [Nigerium massiliense]|uniref:PH domain-containing protein n=1 Tax=Nigerium massiliense TaxID=1522317 RepID=UPI000590F002|nr:PH domain-containing protein [Nigerium massiliense]
MSDVDLFTPPGGTWHRLSPKYATVCRIGATIGCLAVFVPVAVAGWLIWRQWWIPATVATVGAAWWAWRFVRAGKWVASWGYAQRDADLCVRRGLWSKELLVVPFGRMQMVKVNSGPLLRAFGLARVQLVTASATTDAVIPGVPRDEAAELRDRLIELSDAKGAGV